ncbi:MAG: hypothetical protein NTZ61_03635, partial [Proteobacteria bacterium]|nr:hypothetical protein [Pseudomonadota bacterium]
VEFEAAAARYFASLRVAGVSMAEACKTSAALDGRNAVNRPLKPMLPRAGRPAPVGSALRPPPLGGN